MSLLRIRQTDTPVAQNLSSHLNTLGFSWLHGRVAAVAVQKGEVIGTWSREDVPDDLSKLGELVREAVKSTGYRGSTVSLLLAHPRLAHQLIETAPAKGSALEAMIARQADRAKAFEGPAAWSFQTTAGSHNPQSHLLHLLPQSLLDQMFRSVERAGLHLVSVLPPTAVLHGQLTRLPIADDEVAVIAADCGDRVTVVVGRKNGDLLLARSLDVSRGKGAASFGVDLSRTVLFVSQQFGVNVGSVWIFGNGAAERATELQPQIHAPVRISPEIDKPAYWAEDALRLPPEFSPNLISSEQRLAPQRKALIKLTTVISLLLALVAVASVALMLVVSARERKGIAALGKRIQQLQAEHHELQLAHQALDRRAETVKTVVDDHLPPVPAYFLAYLGEIVPAEMRLTTVSVRREGSLWHLQLAGAAQTNAPGRTVNSLAANVGAFAKVLANGPFHVQLAEPPPAPAATPSARELAAGSTANMAARRANPGALPAVLTKDRFTLEGWMK